MSKPRGFSRSTEGKIAGIAYWAGAGFCFLLTLFMCELLIIYSKNGAQEFLIMLSLFLGFTHAVMFIMAGALSSDAGRIRFTHDKLSIAKCLMAPVAGQMATVVLWIFSHPAFEKLYAAGTEWIIWTAMVSLAMLFMICISVVSHIKELSRHQDSARMAHLRYRIKGDKPDDTP